MELRNKEVTDELLKGKIHVDEHKDVQFSTEYMDPDTVCGIGKFKPQWLQKYATSRNYLMIYSIVGIVQGTYYTYLIGIMSTLEKRYAFKSKISGTIMMVDEITPLFLGILVGYFGGRMHKPRVLAAGMYMSVLCCFMSALPYFMYGPSQKLMASSVKNETNIEFCDFSVKHENCGEDDRPPTLTAVVLLCVGSLCKGFGSIAYYTVGLTYMDDSAKKKNSPLYFSFSKSMRLFGPILGFLMSSACLKYYENPLGDPGYDSRDYRWIGAWWLGFVIQGMVLAIISFPLLLFPRRLPKQKIRALSNTRDFENETNLKKLTGMTKALKRLFKNPLYMVFMIGTILSIIGRFGFFMMLPKYMEIQFRLTSSKASLFSGPLGLFAAQITSLLGGWVVYKWRPSAKQLISGHAIIELIWALGMLCLVIPTCQHFDMVNRGITENGLEIQNDCNSECLCSTKYFTPVCGSDGKSNYFSPCHAGCAVDKDLNITFLGNCSCLYSHESGIITKETVVKRGLCDDDNCWEQAVVYIIMFPVICALTNFLSVSHIMILLRSVEPHDKSIGMGTFEAVICALGFIPNPIIYGALADSACLIWESSCGATGNCWYYDIDKFKHLIHGVASGFGLAATVCYFTIYPMSSKLRNLYTDENEEEIPTTKKQSQKGTAILQ